MKGIVRWFDTSKGYGFLYNIENEDDSYFVHINDVESNNLLAQGDNVEFGYVDTEKGKKAIKVKKIE